MFPVEDGRVCLFYIGMRKHAAVLEKDLGILRPLSFFAPSSSILPSHARVTDLASTLILRVNHKGRYHKLSKGFMKG